MPQRQMALIRERGLGRHTILAPLARAGMGEVYRARDERLKRDVAIKVVASARADRSAIRPPPRNRKRRRPAP